jgi:hypothetical protein
VQKDNNPSGEFNSLFSVRTKTDGIDRGVEREYYDISPKSEM